jgi:hypothetical protein
VVVLALTARITIPAAITAFATGSIPPFENWADIFVLRRSKTFSSQLPQIFSILLRISNRKFETLKTKNQKTEKLKNSKTKNTLRPTQN